MDIKFRFWNRHVRCWAQVKYHWLKVSTIFCLLLLHIFSRNRDQSDELTKSFLTTSPPIHYWSLFLSPMTNLLCSSIPWSNFLIDWYQELGCFSAYLQKLFDFYFQHLTLEKSLYKCHSFHISSLLLCSLLEDFLLIKHLADPKKHYWDYVNF